MAHRGGDVVGCEDDVAGFAENLAQSGDGDVAGNFTSAVAAHAISDEVQTVGAEERVFVRLANPTDVRGGSGNDANHRSASTMSDPIWMRSPGRSATTSEMRLPFTRVPLVEPRSSTTAAPFAIQMRA